MSSDKLYMILSEVYSSLKLSEQVYNLYLTEGQVFEHAKSLRRHNLKIKSLLQNNRSSLPGNLLEASTSLVSHYTAWLEKWEDLEGQLKPCPGDKFIFENKHVFPKEACNVIENAYLKLKKDRSL